MSRCSLPARSSTNFLSQGHGAVSLAKNGASQLRIDFINTNHLFYDSFMIKSIVSLDINKLKSIKITSPCPKKSLIAPERCDVLPLTPQFFQGTLCDCNALSIVSSTHLSLVARHRITCVGSSFFPNNFQVGKDPDIIQVENLSI